MVIGKWILLGCGIWIVATGFLKMDCGVNLADSAIWIEYSAIWNVDSVIWITDFKV